MLPPRQLQAAFPCSVQAFSCYSSSKGTCWWGGAGGGTGAWGWACAHRAREKPGLVKGYLVPISALSSSAETSNRVSFNRHPGGPGDSPTAQTCPCENTSLGSSTESFPATKACTVLRGVPPCRGLLTPQRTSTTHPRCSLEPCLSAYLGKAPAGSLSNPGLILPFLHLCPQKLPYTQAVLLLHQDSQLVSQPLRNFTPHAHFKRRLLHRDVKCTAVNTSVTIEWPGGTCVLMSAGDGHWRLLLKPGPGSLQQCDTG